MPKKKPAEKLPPVQVTPVATAKEKAALSGVIIALAIASNGIKSGIQLLSLFAPTQTTLIRALDYIVTILDAVINKRPLPDIPGIETDSASSFALKAIPDGEEITADDDVIAGALTHPPDFETIINDSIPDDCPPRVV